MARGRAHWIEVTADGTAAVLFAAAVAFVLLSAGFPVALVAALPALACAGCFYVLRHVGAQMPRPPRLLHPGELAPQVGGELVLTSTDRVDRPGLRLVPRPMQGESQTSVAPVLAEAAHTPDDDSQALFNALFELRRSLR
jgi:hypothetical protein